MVARAEFLLGRGLGRTVAVAGKMGGSNWRVGMTGFVLLLNVVGVGVGVGVVG